MAEMNTNEELTDLERDLEKRAAEAQRLLALGRDEALEELRGERESLGVAYSNVVKALNRVADEADAQLEGIQERLGQMNYLLAEDAVRTPEEIQAVADDVLEEIEAALDGLEQVAIEKRRGWEKEGSELQQGWRRFRARLELARLHLAKDRAEAAEAFAAERERLIEELTGLSGERGEADLISKVQGGFAELGPWVKALLMLPDEALPQRVRDKAFRPD